MQSTEIALLTALDIMTAEVVAVGSETLVEEAVDLFEEYGVSSLPVVDDERRLLGMITEYGLLQSIRTLDMCGKVADFMTTDIVSVQEDASLVEIIRTFLSSHVRRVPVTANGKLIGVVSRRDLLFAGNVRQQLLAELPAASFVAGMK